MNRSSTHRTAHGLKARSELLSGARATCPPFLLEDQAMNKMARYSQGPGQDVGQDPIKQIFDRLFEGNPFANLSTDESSVVTSQWVPRVALKAETTRLVLYAHPPGVAPGELHANMANEPQTTKRTT